MVGPSRSSGWQKNQSRLSSDGDSDPAVKQLLVNMDEKQSFIIQDLDDNHLLIKADEEDRVRRELDAEVRVPHSNLPVRRGVCGLKMYPWQLERNTYSLDT